MSLRHEQHDAAASAQQVLWPRWWRWAIVSISVVMLCSCRGVSEKPLDDLEGHVDMRLIVDSEVAMAGDSVPVKASRGDTLPPYAWTGNANPNHIPRIPMPGELQPQWAPPGIQRPWPKDEYLFDGGDRGRPAATGKDWAIRGLETEDTIAHFDTLDGETVVVPSNRVCLYAPRFGVVRRVNGVNQYDRGTHIAGADLAVKPINEEERLKIGSVLQPQGAEGQITSRALTIQQTNDPSPTVGSGMAVSEMLNRFKLYENFRIMRDGIAEQTEKPMLSSYIESAIVWSKDVGVQVVLNGQEAVVETGDARVQATYTIDNHNRPQLRIVKVASTKMARPGDEVEFTLRFDNTGTEKIGNVTLVDNLTTRLEYVPKSEKSSLKADFTTQANDAGSLVLRWEITEPLAPGKGGIIRFKCRVR